MYYSYSTDVFEKAYTYHGNDLGARWTPRQTGFRLWAPTAQNVIINLYHSGNPEADDLIRSVPMTPGECGTWVAAVDGDLNGVYYTYLVQVENRTVEACDPYAVTTGVNGKRAMVLDLSSTNPQGWSQDHNPNADMKITDAFIYELHIRDLSMDSSSGISHKGKFLGVIEPGTKNAQGIPTGLDHIKSMGITHLHLLPIYDYGSVDETHLEKQQFNWGYDPVNYNVPEGSYSTDPYHGEVRVKEMKQMIQGLHEAGISVIMDVVYNHVYHVDEYCFNQIVPYYFSRFDENGKLTNASGCGNDTASERSMVHKYIVDSVNYWADEYHIDGFRFDLVGLIDTDTINDLMHTVHTKHPDVIFYGEGWDMAQGITKPNIHMTTQSNAHLVPGFAFFNDMLRDTMRGSVFDTSSSGYISGNIIPKEALAKCFQAAPGWTKDPGQVVNYISCHDNHTLFDRITLSVPKASRNQRIAINRLGAAFFLTSQGIPFFQAGEEMLRSKPSHTGEPIGNSYKSPDRINSIKWSELEHADVLETAEFYRGLIQIRKHLPILRMTGRTEIEQNVTTITCENPHAIVFVIYAPDQRVLVAFNADINSASIKLPSGSWDILAKENKAGLTCLGHAEGCYRLPPLSSLIMIQSRNKLNK